MAGLIVGAVKPTTAPEAINPKYNSGVCNVDLPLLLVTGLRQLAPSRTGTGWMLNGDGCGSDVNWMSANVFLCSCSGGLLTGQSCIGGVLVPFLCSFDSPLANTGMVLENTMCWM